MTLSNLRFCKEISLRTLFLLHFTKIIWMIHYDVANSSLNKGHFYVQKPTFCFHIFFVENLILSKLYGYTNFSFTSKVFEGHSYFQNLTFFEISILFKIRTDLNFVCIIILERCNFFIIWSLTLNVMEGHKVTNMFNIPPFLEDFFKIWSI